MIVPDRDIRLLVTIALGLAGHDVTVKRVAIADDPAMFPEMPELEQALADVTLRSDLNDWQRFRERKKLAQCLLMDRHDVPNGNKAIDIAIRRHWTPRLAMVFGEPNDPSSIRRWRARRAGPARHEDVR